MWEIAALLAAAGIHMGWMAVPPAERVSTPTNLTVGEIDRRLTGAVEALAGRVGDVDRRLARLEGWIEGERAGRSSMAREAPDTGGEGGG